MIGRFAPSPTGAMHLGNARTALLAWLHTRARGGRHLLRFEDLDAGRVRPWAYDLTRRDLLWLGLDWDAEYRQTERQELYQSALAKLDTYPCACSRKEIGASVGAPHGAEVVYPGTCREGPSAARAAAWRWRVPDWEVCARDELSGPICQNLPAEVGDFVLRRNDGAYAYHLAVVVDDAEMGITDVVRGADLLTATPRQVALQRALGYSTPLYFHVPLLRGIDGQRLAKRGGAPPVSELRERGVTPGAVLARLARSLGWAVDGEVTAAELIPQLDPLYRNIRLSPTPPGLSERSSVPILPS